MGRCKPLGSQNSFFSYALQLSEANLASLITLLLAFPQLLILHSPSSSSIKWQHLQDHSLGNQKSLMAVTILVYGYGRYFHFTKFSMSSCRRNKYLTQIRTMSSQSYGFSSSHVWLWELDYKESWMPKNWCFWTVVLEKTLESPLDCKIRPVNPKGDQSWIFMGRTDAEAETPILWPLDAKNWLIWKDPDAGKDWRWEEKGTTETRSLDGIDSMEVNLNKLWEIVKNRKGRHAAVHGVTESGTTERLKNKCIINPFEEPRMLPRK